MSRLRALAAAFQIALAVLLTGCPQPVQFLYINLENPNLLVGDQTTLRIEALAGAFRDPIFFYKADRGRLVSLNGETAQPGQYLRAGNVVKYYAPFTSSFISPSGQQQGDVIRIIAQDGGYTTQVEKSVQLTGTTVLAVEAQPGRGDASGRILFTNRDNGTPQPLRDITGKEITGTSPVISPNGRRIAYVTYPGDGSARINVMEANGQIQSLTNNTRQNLDPAFSPDGIFMLYASNADTGNGTYDIYMMNIDQGKAITRLTNNTWDDRHPAWNPLPSAPEDRLIALTARSTDQRSPGGQNRPWNIFLMNRQGVYTRLVSDTIGDQFQWSIEPSWRPDGNALAYTRNGRLFNVQASGSVFQRVVVQELNVQTPAPVPLNPTNTDPNARESSAIWAVDRANDVIYLRADANTQATGRIYRSTYTGNQGFGTPSFLPQPVPNLSNVLLPLVWVNPDDTNRAISGYHVLDWR